MYRGYIKLHRKFLNWYGSGSSTRVNLWVHLLLNANHADQKFLFNGEPIVVKRGSFITGRLKLSIDTGISESYTQKLLKEFEKEGMLEQQTTNRNRLITITCWNEYQVEEQQKDNRKTTERQQKDTNKNVKNIKNEKNIYNIKDFPFLSNSSFSKTFDDYRDFRKQINSKMTPRAEELALKKLHKTTVDISIKMLEESITNGWKGIFPLKTTKAKKGSWGM